MDAQMIYGVGLIAVPVLLSITLHEFGHARAAVAFGDLTPQIHGRVTINPLAHLDPLGTLCFLFGPVGWAKPVPVDFTRLRPYRVGDICVSLAGVGMNALLLLFGAAALNIMAAAGLSVDPGAGSAPTAAGIAAFMLAYLMTINLALIVFNLIPLFPLDGHHVLRELLPRQSRRRFMEFQVRYGGPLLLGMLVLPWVARMATGRAVFNPIGRLIGGVVFPAAELLLGREAEFLFNFSYFRYGPYLSWW